MRGEMDCYGISDIGCVRQTNQDQFLIADLRKSIEIHYSSLGYDRDTEVSGASRAKVLLVADGMGGHEGGQRASSMAVEGVIQYLLTDLHWPIDCKRDHEARFFRGLHRSLEYSRDRIRVAGELNPHQGQMGTTLTMCWLVWPHVYLIHVGDSRAYLFRDGSLELLSHDQTFAQTLIDQGIVQADTEIAKSYSHMLTSALGCSSNMEPLYGRVDLRLDDKLMLCSDGLNKHLSEAELENILLSCADARSGCERMVEAAKSAGGRDNITVVLANFCSRKFQPWQEDRAVVPSKESLSS